MITCDPPDTDPYEPPSPGREIAQAVAIALLSAAATGLVEWGIEEMRERWGRKTKAKGRKR